MTPGEFQRELVYQHRMLSEPWRRVGLLITSVCRCFDATPCFDHMTYLADLRTDADDLEDAGKTKKAVALRKKATDFYLKLTAKEEK